MAESVSKIIGSRIAISRHNKNYSQAEVCRLGDFHKASYSNWENGRRTPSLDDAKKLGNVLGVSAAYILNLTDYPARTINNTDKDSLQYIPIYTNETLEQPRSKWATLTHLPVQSEYFGSHEPNTFAFVVNDNSMNTIAAQNDIVLISPCTKPNHGDIVLAKSKCNNLIFLRTFHVESSIEKKIIRLKPTNETFSVLNVEDDSKIEILGYVKNMKKIIF